VQYTLGRSASKVLEETGTEIQVPGATAHAPVNDLGLNCLAIGGDRNCLKTMGASGPRWSVKCDDKITVSILVAASTQPDVEERELARRSLLEGLERVVPRKPLGVRVRIHGSRGESDCTGGEDEEGRG